jgi:murein DD-endopeptidase MepM/ murein hydrolase activator NlpD
MDRNAGWTLLLSVIAALLHASSVRPPPSAAPSLPAIAKAPVPRPPATASPSALLAQRKLTVPVKGIARSKVQDNFNDERSRGRKHKAIDIMAPRGTPVLAADDGAVAKISSNKGGGLALYQVDGTGRIVYYYAHLDGYAPDLKEGQKLRRGDVIGYVGTTGNAPESAPHLHFAVFVVERQGRWWGGEAINPYAALVREEPGGG